MKTDEDMQGLIMAISGGAVVILTIIGGLYYIFSSMIEASQKEKQEIHDCFVQEPKTKECEYVLWQYEHKNKKIYCPSNLAAGMIIGSTMMRR